MPRRLPNRTPIDPAVIASDAIRPGLPGLSQLAHRTIRLPSTDEGMDLGPITLGERIGGDGHYGFLYAIVGRPDLYQDSEIMTDRPNPEGRST
jgi:hypothetical protein